MTKILAKKVIKFLIILLIIIGIGFLFYLKIKNTNSQNQNETIQKALPEVTILNIKDINSNLSYIPAIGKIESLEKVDLKNELSSTIKNIYVDIGTKVKKGDILIELDHQTIDAQLAQAKSAISRVKGNLNLQLAGPKDTDIKQVKIKIEQAEVGLNQSKTQLENVQLLNKSKIENAKLTLELAKADLLNTDSLNTQNTNTTLDNSFGVLRDALNFIKTTLITLTGIQYKHYNCFDTVFCSSIAQEKEKIIFEIYNIQNGGRLNLETVSKLNGGLSNLLTNNSLSKEEFQQNIPFLIVGLKNLNVLVEKFQVANGSQFGNSVLLTDKATIQAFITTINYHINALTNSLNLINSLEINKKSINDTRKSVYDKALENYETILKQTKQDELLAINNITTQKTLLNQAKTSYDSLISNPREVELESNKSLIMEAEANYSLIKSNLDKAFIKAPFSGVVSTLPVKKGELVSYGTRLIGLANKEGLRVTTYLTAQDSLLIEQNNEVLIEEKYNGTVLNIAPNIDPQTKKVEIIILIQQDNFKNIPLLIDQSVSLKFKVKNKNNIYLLPLTAIKTKIDGSYVFKVLKNNSPMTNQNYKTVLSKISIGRIIGDNIEVFEGINENDFIIESIIGLNNEDEIKIKDNEK